MPLFARPVRRNALLYAAWALFALSLTLPAVWMPEFLNVPAGYIAGAVCAWVAGLNLGDLFAMTSDSYMGLLTFANVLMVSSLFWRRGARGKAWPVVAFAVAAAVVAGTPFVFSRSMSGLLASLVFVWGYYVWLAAFVLVAVHFAVQIVATKRLPLADDPGADGLPPDLPRA
ncbi:hypothetical protein [Rubrivirga sp.]|uniref:hypothetical protein n=1 Tax=Rubrivirga sp. TaxID=1885344 RepID=UPI003B520C7B